MPGKYRFKTYMEIGHKKLQLDVECNVNKQDKDFIC